MTRVWDLVQHQQRQMPAAVAMVPVCTFFAGFVLAESSEALQIRAVRMIAVFVAAVVGSALCDDAVELLRSSPTGTIHRRCLRLVPLGTMAILAFLGVLAGVQIREHLRAPILYLAIEFAAFLALAVASAAIVELATRSVSVAAPPATLIVVVALTALAYPTAFGTDPSASDWRQAHVWYAAAAAGGTILWISADIKADRIPRQP